MKTNWVFLFFTSLVWFGCGQSIKFQKTDSGVEYHYYYQNPDTSGGGKPGDYYLLDMIGQREDDSIFINSYVLNQKIKIVRSKDLHSSMFNEVLAMLRKGDSICVQIPADSFFKPLGQTVPKYLADSKKLRFTIKVSDIMSQQQHLLSMYNYEFDKMVEFLERKAWNYQTDTLTGIKYEVLNTGNGIKAIQGDTAEVSYLLTYLDGKIINKTKEGDPLRFVVGSEAYMNGISRLVTLVAEGTKLRGLIPFSEGFGETGSAYIDPYATLIIEMEILKIKKHK